MNHHGRGTSFLYSIIPYDRKTPIDTEENPHTLPNLPALKATIRPAGVRRGKLNYTVDECSEVGRTAAPEIEAARRYLIRGEHPQRKIDIEYPEHHIPEWPGIETVTHEKHMPRTSAEQFVSADYRPTDLRSRTYGTRSVYQTRKEILEDQHAAHNEDTRVTVEHSERERAAGNVWPYLGPYEPTPFEDWCERWGHPDDYKHYGAIPGTAKIIDPARSLYHRSLDYVTVVWETKPTAADKREARRRWMESLPHPNRTTTLTEAAHLRGDDADGAETRKVLRKEGLTIEKYDATEEFRKLGEVSWERHRSMRRELWIADEADRGRLPFLDRAFFRQTRAIPRAELGKLIAQKIRRSVDAEKIGKTVDPVAERAWDLEHGFVKISKSEQRILDAGGTLLDAAAERAKIDAKNAARAAKAKPKETDYERIRRAERYMQANFGWTIPVDAWEFEFEGRTYRIFSKRGLIDQAYGTRAEDMVQHCDDREFDAEDADRESALERRPDEEAPEVAKYCATEADRAAGFNPYL